MDLSLGLMSQFVVLRRGGIPGNPIAAFLLKNGMVDSIGVSVEFYDAVGPVWQPLLFDDASTPSSMTVEQALANEHLNEFNVVGNEKFFAIYHYDTSWSVIDKVWRYGNLPKISLPDPWDDTIIWGDNYYEWSEA
jgi:hypothetical protein